MAYITVAVLAFSNGYIASNSMMLGPQQVPVRVQCGLTYAACTRWSACLRIHGRPPPLHQVSASQQEHAGNMMAWLLLTGLTVGAVIGEIFPVLLADVQSTV